MSPRKRIKGDNAREREEREADKKMKRRRWKTNEGKCGKNGEED